MNHVTMVNVNSPARAKHKLALHSVKWKSIYDRRATIPACPHLAGKLGSFAERFPQDRLGNLAVKRNFSGADEIILPSNFSVAFSAA